MALPATYAAAVPAACRGTTGTASFMTALTLDLNLTPTRGPCRVMPRHDAARVVACRGRYHQEAKQCTSLGQVLPRETSAGGTCHYQRRSSDEHCCGSISSMNGPCSTHLAAERASWQAISSALFIFCYSPFYFLVYPTQTFGDTHRCPRFWTRI